LKHLTDILNGVELAETIGSIQVEVFDIHFDSRMVKPGWLFVAVRGLNANGHDFIEQAIQNGATSIVCEQKPTNITQGVTLVRVNDSAKALGTIASNMYDNPSGKIKLVGITGTNGKTTIVTLLHQLFSKSGFKCGMISTVKNMVGQKETESVYTTPDPRTINCLLSDMVNQGCQYVFMEVSSHAIDQQRVSGLNFAGGVFTNLSHDHLDYHKSFDAYLKAKKTFFDNLPAESFAITNADDKNGRVMLQNTRATKKTYGLKTMADFKGKIIGNNLSGLQMMVDGRETWYMLVGEFNAYNILAAYSTALMLGLEKLETLTNLTSCQAAEGRFDLISVKSGATAIVDYAHTPDALENVLRTIGSISEGKGKVITVVGCGGNRDVAKRPTMAAIAAGLSNQLIITSDNPRFEDPDQIIGQMLAGLDPAAKKRTITIPNRKEAIKTACTLASKGDIILVAGKGHEKYQEIGGVKYPFDDKQVLNEFLNS